MNKLIKQKPEGVSKGQTLTYFLTWLHEQKGYRTYDGSYRVADVTHIPDEELEELYQAFLDDFLKKYQS